MDKNGNTPLHIAIAMSTLVPAYVERAMAVVRFLIEKGADLQATNRNGTTLLQYAVLSSNKDAVELLLRKGVDINARNNDGKTALQLAEREKLTAMIELLKKLGAN